MIDSKNLAKMFLAVSKDDLEASKLIYRNSSLYAQSIFLLQQSVEKALKAALIYSRVAPEKEEELDSWLRTIVSHYVITNMSKIVNKLITSSYLKIGTIEKPLFQLLIKLLESTANEYSKEVKKFEKLDVVKYENVEKMVIWIIKSSDNSTLEQKFSEIFIKIPQLIKEKIPIHLINFIKEMIIQLVRLSIMSLIFEKFESISRYPDIRNPSLGPNLFTKEYPLIRKLDDLQNIVQESIDRLHMLVDLTLFTNPKEV